ncbi:MAG TPA: hypothetical protein VEW93_00520 [Acidimicrobiales bacterium]|nr:hypothetical protein [Acidimicrobiales bacterium]
MAGAEPDRSPSEAVAPPRWAALVAVVVLGAMAVALVAPVRFALWPITSWELFSRPRVAEQATYRVDLVAPDGAVGPLPFSRLGAGHRRWLTIARTFPAVTPEERARVCRAWADAAVAALGAGQVGEVRVRRVVNRAAPRAADPPRPVSERLVVRCTPS